MLIFVPFFYCVSMMWREWEAFLQVVIISAMKRGYYERSNCRSLKAERGCYRGFMPRAKYLGA